MYARKEAAHSSVIASRDKLVLRKRNGSWTLELCYYLSGCSGRSSCGKVLVLVYIVIERRRANCAVSHAERQHANLSRAECSATTAMALLAIGSASVGADLGKEPLALLRG